MIESEKRYKLDANRGTFRNHHDIGSIIFPYKKTYGIEGDFINDAHRFYSQCQVQDQILIDTGIEGWLRREDALKIYELAYFSCGDILELGCFKGLSTSVIAQAIADSGRRLNFSSIDLVESHVIQTKNTLSRILRKINGKVHVAEGNAFCESLVNEGRSFGFVFVDHSHEFCLVQSAAKLLNYLVAPGGFCLFHDYNDSRNKDPNDHDYGVYQGVHEGLDMNKFEFFGIFGCCGLFRMKPLAWKRK